MTTSVTFTQLKNFTDRIGPIYGTEDWAIFLYALVKMHAPINVLELGTGLGASALWVARALQENGVGKIFTVDDGRHWPEIVKNNPELLSPAQNAMTFAEYVAALRQEFGLEDRLELIVREMPPFPVLDQKIDMLFSDFMHGPNEVLHILGHFLPNMSASSSLFIDSASTSFPSYALLEMLVGQLSAGKLPRMLLNYVSEALHESLWRQVRSSQYTLIHLVEKKKRAQNSTAWLKIQPVDLRPYPSAPFH
jgi:predicted O-methyltransferase YrrM